MADPSSWDLRTDKSRKGSGYFGVLRRPDGKVSSELSIGVDMDGRETEIPTLVPTLTATEVQQLLTMNVERGQIPRSIIRKAVAFAQQRRAAGLPYFAQPGEQQYDLHPQFERAATISDVPLASSRQGVDPAALERLIRQRFGQ